MFCNPISAGTVSAVTNGLDSLTIPAGIFTMGSPEGVGYSDEHPAHEVELSQFSIGHEQVTIGQYDAYLKQQRKTPVVAMQFLPNGLPQILGRLEDAKAFRSARGESLRDTQLTLLDHGGLVTLGGITLFEVGRPLLPATNRYSHFPVTTNWFEALAFAAFYGWTLPTEAELERLYKGPSNDDWLFAGTRENGFGMSLQVLRPEWCLDIYAPYLATAQKDPVGTADRKWRVVRGKSAFDIGDDVDHRLYTAKRSFSDPEARSSEITFRVVSKTL